MSQTVRILGNMCTSCVVAAIVVISVITAGTLAWVMMM